MWVMVRGSAVSSGSGGNAGTAGAGVRCQAMLEGRLARPSQERSLAAARLSSFGTSQDHVNTVVQRDCQDH